MHYNHIHKCVWFNSLVHLFSNGMGCLRSKVKLHFSSCILNMVSASCIFWSLPTSSGLFRTVFALVVRSLWNIRVHVILQSFWMALISETEHSLRAHNSRQHGPDPHHNRTSGRAKTCHLSVSEALVGYGKRLRVEKFSAEWFELFRINEKAVHNTPPSLERSWLSVPGKYCLIPAIQTLKNLCKKFLNICKSLLHDSLQRHPFRFLHISYQVPMFYRKR